MTLSLAAKAAAVPWTLEQRLEWTSEASSIAEQVGDPNVRLQVATDYRECLLESAADRGDLDEQARLVRSLLDRVPNAALRWNARFFSAMEAILDGDVDLAERVAEETLSYGLDTGQPDALIIYSAQFINVCKCRGRFGEVVPFLEEAVRDHPALPVYRAVLASALAEADDLPATRRVFNQDRDAGFEMTEDNAWSTAHMHWATAAIALKDQEAAEVLHQRLWRYRDQVATTYITVDPVIGHYIARLEHHFGRLDEASASFARAHQLHERLRAPQFVARTEVRWAQLLLDRAQRDDHDRARALADSALEASGGRSGWQWIERDANSVLERLR